MAFEDKKGIVVASPFKLQAEALLDVRQQVDTIAERDRLVTLKAATAGLRVFVKENSTSYVYTGSKWDPLATGAPYKHPTGDGNHHVPATGTTNAGKYLKAGATAGSEAWSKIAASDITGLPTRLPNPQALKFTGAATATYDGSGAVTVNIPTSGTTDASLTLQMNGGTTEGTNKFTFNGSAAKIVNITPALIGAATSNHTHSPASIGAATAVHNHEDADITWADKSLSGRLSPLDSALSNVHSANRFAFADPAGITAEYSRNNGDTWQAYDTNDSQKIHLVSGLGTGYSIGAASTGITNQYKLRITLNASKMKVYTALKKLLINISTNGATGCKCQVEKAQRGSETNFDTVGTYNIDGWSGWNSIPIKGAFGGSESQTSNLGAIRLTFYITSVTSSPSNLTVSDIYAVGDTYWTTPSVMAKTGHMYEYDSEKNVTFPANLTAKTFIGNLSGTATALSTNAGAANKPVYFKEGKPVECTHTLDKSVPSNAVFTDTVYTHPDSHPATMITQDNTHRFVTDAEKTVWNGKAPASHTHPASQITGLPTKLPNPQPLKFTGAATATYDGSGAVTVNIPTAQASPHALTVQLNGGSTENTNKFTFNGGAAKNINITPASIGAAASTHSHNYAGSGSAGGAANSAVKLTTARTINGVLFDGTSNIEIPNNYSKALNAEDLNTILAIGEYYAGGGNTVKNKPSGVQHFGMKVYKVASGYIAQKLHGSDNIIYYRVHNNASFGAWQKVYSTAAKPTAAEIGAAPSSHNHTASQITGLPTKLPNPQPLKFTGAATATYDGSGAVTVNIPTAQASPHALTVQLNGGTTEGTNKFTFNGGAAKNINITPASIGAALASHTHSGYAPTSHTHTAGQITGLPTSLKNPYALTIKTNGSAAATYDGSAVKEVNITAAGIGAAATSHGHNLGNGTTPGFTKLYKWEDNPNTEDFTGAITPQFLAQFTTNKIVPRISENADNISKIVNGTTPVGKSKQLVDSVNNQGIGLTYDEISKTGPFGRCKFAVFYNNSIIGGMTPNRVTDFIGAAKASHTHDPYSIGAAPSSHTHNYAGSSSAGGPANSAKKVDFPVGTVLWTTSSSATFFSSTCGGTWEVVGNIDTIINSSTTLTLYMHKKKAL